MKRYGMLLTLFMALHVLPGNTGTTYAQNTLKQQFSDALSAFEAGEYERAFRGFWALYEQDARHPQAAAAWLMAGKARYRQGRFQASMDLLQRFRLDHPGSAYLAEAERVIAYCRLNLRHAQERANALRLGVALPLSVADPAATQALFNGIHTAVVLHNSKGGRPVQIIFRDTHQRRNGVDDAVHALIGLGVDAIIGPLYSSELPRVAPLAEEAGVVMVAPLANVPDITGHWRHVFLANPTIVERGRFMAQQAVTRFGYGTVGLVTEPGQRRSEDLGRGFEEEARTLGAAVVFHLKLASPRDWVRLPDLVDEDTLRSVEALYLPVHRAQGSEERRMVESILTRLGRVPDAPHILGTTTWQNVKVSTFADRLDISYADVFHVRHLQADVREFLRQYHALNVDGSPGRLTYVGFDVATMLLEGMVHGGDLVEYMSAAAPFEGLGTRVKFDGNRRNTGMYLLHLDRQGSWLVR